jgi:hypothetical protein
MGRQAAAAAAQVAAIFLVVSKTWNLLPAIQK